ncbi:MAG: formate dehydrogenase subunit gamma [Planctomycetota bacterium]
MSNGASKARIPREEDSLRIPASHKMPTTATTLDEAAEPSDLAATLETARTRPVILRFRRSERLLHWAIAAPFMVCFLSAYVLFVFYTSDSSLPFRSFFSWAHRIGGVCFIALPALVLVTQRRDYAIHLENIKEGWSWSMSDIKWLMLMPLSVFNKKIELPEQGKFNAAEKLNFMNVMATYPLYIITGLMIWTQGAAFWSWVLHVSMAAAATPLLLGHIYMAVCNPETRIGLSGMFTGRVDAEWAKHHYRNWYREKFELPMAGAGRVPLDPAEPPARPKRNPCG